MSDEQRAPSRTTQLAQAVARELAARAARELASKALVKIGAVVGAKAGLIAAVIAIVIILVVLVIALIIASIGAAFQSSTAAWPAPVATDAAGGYRAGGWAISSGFGWRNSPLVAGSEFHDGIDLVNPHGMCPFGYHCGATAMFDGKVGYVGWDTPSADDPAKAGGGMVVVVDNGANDHQTVYAHLEPYRLYVQLQGRIDDEYGRYDDYRDYRTIGEGELTPGLGAGDIEIACMNEMPNFVPTRSGPGTIVFLYDRPASCITTVTWGERGGDWQGWLPEDLASWAGGPRRATLPWQTAFTCDPRADWLCPSARRANDVALRFRARLVPPPPPPTATPTLTDTTLLPTPTPLPTPAAGAAAAAGMGGPHSGGLPLADPPARAGKPRTCAALASGWVRCAWALADIPTEQERFAAQPDPWIVAALATAENGAAPNSPRPTLTSPGRTTWPRESMGGVAQHALLQDSPTPTPSLKVVGTTSLSSANLGQVFSLSFTMLSNSPAAHAATLRIPLGDHLEGIKAGATSGACAISGGEATCALTIGQNNPASVSVQVMLRKNAPPDTFITITATAADDRGASASSSVTIRSTRLEAEPTATPATPTSTPTPAPTATPGGRAAFAAMAPTNRQWILPGASASWTIALGANAGGYWSLAIAPSDARLLVNLLDADGNNVRCQTVARRLICPGIPGTTMALQLLVTAPSDGLGLQGDVNVAISDIDVQGGGAAIGVLHALVGVGAAPTATPTPELPAYPGGAMPDCAPQPLVQLAGVTAPQPRMVQMAADSFQAVRAEIRTRSGIDALNILADVLRAPGFTTAKAGVLRTSWHKAGRAVDLNQGGPFVRVAEGYRFRLYVNNVDITAIFEAHGWNRIPAQGNTSEWWHYEYHPDGIAWTSAMLQAWPIETLRKAFPEIEWEAIGCAGGANNGGSDPTIAPQESEALCALEAPSYAGLLPVEYVQGCGPPIQAGERVYQLDSMLGFVGLTGRTTGPHLHLGLRVRSYNGSWPTVNICAPEWLRGHTPPPDASCFTSMADPLAFLPRAPGSAALPAQPAAPANGATPTAIIPEGAPYQLPPPGHPNALVFTPVPGATPAGQYWSPYADGGRYGGGDVSAWLCTNVWGGFPWCST